MNWAIIGRERFGNQDTFTWEGEPYWPIRITNECLVTFGLKPRVGEQITIGSFDLICVQHDFVYDCSIFRRAGFIPALFLQHLRLRSFLRMFLGPWVFRRRRIEGGLMRNGLTYTVLNSSDMWILRVGPIVIHWRWPGLRPLGVRVAPVELV